MSKSNSKRTAKTAAADRRQIASTLSQIHGAIVCALAAGGQNVPDAVAAALWGAARLASNELATLQRS
jgi:hypothetical protein